MTNIKLDPYEKEIENNILKFRKISGKKLDKIKSIIKNANDKKNISLRVNTQDLEQIKLKAEKAGIPYQTFISSILHKFVSDQFVEQKSILKSIQLLKANR